MTDEEFCSHYLTYKFHWDIAQKSGWIELKINEDLLLSRYCIEVLLHILHLTAILWCQFWHPYDHLTYETT